MASQPAHSADRQQLHDLVEELADQLCPAVDGEFDFAVKVSAHDESIDKLQMLINLVLDSARRGLDDLTKKNRDLAEHSDSLTRARSALEHEAAQRAHSEIQYRAILDNAADGIVTIDEGGIVESFNAAASRIFGYIAEEVLGRNIKMLMPSPDREGHDGYIHDYLRTGVAKVVGIRREVVGRRKDGSTFPLDLHVAELQLGERRVFTGVVRDITEQKQTQDRMRENNAMMIDALEREKRSAIQLEAAMERLTAARDQAKSASRAKSEFLANMSHAILGFADALLDNLHDPENVEAVSIIKQNGQHLLQIINDILDISKIEAGKLEVERIRCSPAQVVAEVKALMQVRADAKDLRILTEYIGNVPETIESDPTRLKQILVNLVGNAVKFTEVGGVRLIIRFIDDGPEPKMQFDVLDTGIGMTAEHVSRLFQAFSQADSSTTRKFGGTGLGLMISKRLAEMLGGNITVESKLGQWSQFRFTVTTGPLDGVKMLEDPAMAAIANPEEITAAKGDVSSLDCRILLAEDGPDNQRLIAHMLKKAGAQVAVVENGKLAADAALAARDGDKPFDVIVMDMQMPVMDGYEATGLLRRKGYTRPILALTAHTMAGDRQKCLAAGCDDYAMKPIDRYKLIESIKTLLAPAKAADTSHAQLIGAAAASQASSD